MRRVKLLVTVILTSVGLVVLVPIILIALFLRGCMEVQNGQPPPPDRIDTPGAAVAMGDQPEANGQDIAPPNHQFVIGKTTRDQLLAQLHEEPMYSTPNGRSLIFSQRRTAGHIPLYGSASADNVTYYLRLNFDTQGVLTSAVVEKRHTWDYEHDPAWINPYAHGLPEPKPWPPVLSSAPATAP